MNSLCRYGTFCFLSLIVANAAVGGDWARFRGPNGSGVSSDSSDVPTEWSESKNVKWSTKIPGPGLSSPIVIGNRVVVTCWSGYGTGDGDAGSIEDLKRQIVCLDRGNGDVLWTHSEKAVLPEESYRGMFAEHGYASHTPVSDGKNVYAFFGKSGVVAVSLSSGEKLWQTSVGTMLEQRGWGSASSPVLYQNLVIVPAFIEGDALVALNRDTGEVAWKQSTPGYTDNWSTPVLVPAGDDRTDLVLAVPGEVWGLNPSSGKLRWYCEIPGSDSARASVVAHDDVVVAMGSSRGGGSSLAVRAGGKGDVANSHVLWRGRDSSGIGTPVIHNDRVYIVNNKVVTTVDLASGERISQTRLSGSGGGLSSQPQRGQIFGRRSQDYSSPIVVGNHLYYSSRIGDMFVLALRDEPKQIAVNIFDTDRGEYNSTPAVSDGQLFIRTNKAVYCVAK